MEINAENHHFVGALLLSMKGVPYHDALSMTYENMREHVQALETLEALSDAERKAIAPFLDNQGT
jgi:hypothetical protein